MQFLIEYKDYTFKKIIVMDENIIKEVDEKEKIQTKLKEEFEKIKKNSPYLSILFESALKNLTPFYYEGDIYFFNLNNTEKDFIKSFKTNLNQRINLKLSLEHSLKFRYIEEINQYMISFYKNNYINFLKNEFLYQPDFTLKFENKYDILLGKTTFLKGQGKRKFLYKNFQLKDIELSLLPYIFTEYLNFLAKENPIMNDLLNDFTKEKTSINVPFDFCLLKEAKNKKQLIELKLKKVKRKYKLYNCFNKLSLNGSYSLLKSDKFLNNKDFPKYKNFDLSIFPYAENKRVSTFLYYLIKNGTMTEELQDKQYLSDYINILIRLKGKYKINLNIKTNKKLISEHDKIYKIYKKEKFRKDKMVIKENNPFLKLELPKNIKILNTKKKLFDEGERMEHCAYTYLPYINDEICMLYTYLKEGKRYTIEIIKKGKKFYLNQLKGYRNSEPPQEVIEYVKKAIEQANIKLLENK